MRNKKSPVWERFTCSCVGVNYAYFCSINLRNIDSIIQLLYFFFSDNATIIYWMKETNNCFLRIASKACQDFTKFIHII